jgi:hypothetical protein
MYCVLRLRGSARGLSQRMDPLVTDGDGMEMNVDMEWKGREVECHLVEDSSRQVSKTGVIGQRFV